MKRATIIALLLMLPIALAAQTASATFKGSSQVSLQAVSAAASGTIFQNTRDTYGNYATMLTWSAVFSGAPTSTSLNLEGSTDLTVYTAAGAVTSGAAVFTDNTNCPFVATDVGKEVQVAGAGASAAKLITTVLTYTNACQVTLAANAGTTVTAATYSTSRWFTLDTSTVTTNETRHVVNKPVLFTRCNLVTLSGGASPTATCRIATF